MSSLTRNYVLNGHLPQISDLDPWLVFMFEFFMMLHLGLESPLWFRLALKPERAHMHGSQRVEEKCEDL